MAQSPDLLFEALSTVQGSQGPLPTTIASGTTIAPTTYLSLVTGTAAVGTITPPITGAHQLCLVFTNAAPGTTLTTGNIVNAVTPTTNVPVIAVYNPLTAKYHLK